MWALSMRRIPLNSPAELINIILNADVHLNMEKLKVRAFVLNVATIFYVILLARNLVVHQGGQVDLAAMI